MKHDSCFTEHGACCEEAISPSVCRHVFGICRWIRVLSTQGWVEDVFYAGLDNRGGALGAGLEGPYINGIIFKGFVRGQDRIEFGMDRVLELGDPVVESEWEILDAPCEAVKAHGGD